MQTILLYKRLFSLFYPLCIRKGLNEQEPALFLFRGRYQLATSDALYSDGIEYRPLKIAFKKLEHHLPTVKNVLVLGTGLGSAVHILYDRGYQPSYTLVEKNKTVLEWALEFLPANITYITPVCDDAREFVERDNETYDLVVTDVFNGRYVPDFVTGLPFLWQCKKKLSMKGFFVLNYMVNDAVVWRGASANILQVFPDAEIIEIGINRVIIAKA